MKGDPPSKIPVEVRLYTLLNKDSSKDNENDPGTNGFEEQGELITGKFKRGETIFSILKKHGVSKKEIYSIVDSFSKIVNPRSIRVGARYKIVLNREKEVVSVEIKTSPTDVFGVEKTLFAENTQFQTYTKHIDKIKKIEPFGCKIFGTLEDSILRCNGDKVLLSKIISLMKDSFNFYIDIHSGDEIRVIVEKHYLKDKFLSYGKILALSYKGKKKNFQAFYYESPDGKWAYYDENGDSINRQFLRYPLKYKRISSGFTKKRMHPILHKYKKHLAIDFAAPVGTPVKAVAGGTVVFMGKSGASGNLLIIKHKNHYKSYYAHLQKFAKNLKKSSHVKQGQVIGYVGKTGRATGPHLHFVLKKGKRYLNFFKIKNPPLFSIPENFKNHFLNYVKSYKQQLRKIDVSTSGYKKT